MTIRIVVRFFCKTYSTALVVHNTDIIDSLYCIFLPIVELPFYFQVLSFAFNKVKLFAEVFYENSNLDDSGIYLPAYLRIYLPSRNNLKLHDTPGILTAQKMKFSIKDFFRKCYQIRSFLRIWSHLL